MLDNINIEKYKTLILDWLIANVWTTNSLYQGIIILSAFVIGSIVYGIAKPKLVKRAEKIEAPTTAKRVINNLVRLCFPLFTLIFIFIGAQIAAMGFSIDTKLSIATMKVLMAWIIIRTAVQFINNATVRNIFALITWTIAVLSIFGLLGQTTAALEGVAFTIGDFRLSALAVIKSLLMLFALLYFAIFVSGFAEQKVFRIQSLSRSSQVLIAKITRVALIATALLIGVTSAGIDLSLFAVFGGAIGLGIGFGLQKVISNLFSGMLLLVDKSIKPGDVIELPDIGTFGWVNDMSARYTEIITRDNKSYLIPNEDFITQRVVNWSHGDSLIRVSVEFGVHYNSDPEQVIALCIEAAKKPERVVDHRQPVCWLTEFADSSINFSLRFWIKDAAEGITNVKGEVLLELWKVFKEHNIEIPYPHREVYVHDVKNS